MQSCIFEGQLRHSRRAPAHHAFRYRLFMLYLDLDELPEVFRSRWLWSDQRPAVARFRRSDHLGPDHQPLSESVRDLVAIETGRRPDGPIRLLTNLSYFGYSFNPVSFFYCFSDDGETLETIVAEVNNTPWGEQDTYVLPAAASVGSERALRFRPKKKMHVSPFMPMDVDYDWSFTPPGERLNVYMANSKAGEKIFDASLNLQRIEMSGPAMARILAVFPVISLKVIVAIYWQALRLWLKRCPLYAHPQKKKTMAVPEP